MSIRRAFLLAVFFCAGCSTRQHVLSATPDGRASANDFLELRAGGFKGDKETFRLYADGRVVRNSAVVWDDGSVLGCSLHTEDRRTHIDAAKANKLVVDADHSDFVSLKPLYKSNALDGGTAELSLSIGGQRKDITDHNGQPPALFSELMGKLESLVGPMPAYSRWAHHSDARSAECIAEANHPERVLRLHRELFPGDKL